MPDHEELSIMKQAQIPLAFVNKHTHTHFFSQVAKRELRQLRQNAREGTKLLEDKRVLENRCVELQGTLETVQGQRNELRHQVHFACVCCSVVCVCECA